MDENESTSQASPLGPCGQTLADIRRCFQGSAADTLAFVISALTSPFLVCALMAAALAAKLARSWRDAIVWGVVSAVCAGVLPLLVVLLAVARHQLKDIHVAQRERRWMPLGAAVLSGFAGLLVLRRMGAPIELQGLAAAYVINAAAFGVVSHYWKISVHAGVYAGGLAACALVAGPVWWLALTGLPFVVWARTWRGRHTVLQGLTGAAMGVLLTVASYAVVVRV